MDDKWNPDVLDILDGIIVIFDKHCHLLCFQLFFLLRKIIEWWVDKWYTDGIPILNDYADILLIELLYQFIP